MKLGVTRRTAVLGLAGAFLVGNLGFFLWYRSTAQDRKAGMEARRQTLEREVDAREKEAAALAGQRDRLSKVSEAIDEFYGRRVGSQRDTLAPIVVELHSLLAKVNIAPQSISYATKPIAKLPLAEMTITFGFRSDYERFKQLLASIESDRKWLVVRDIAVAVDRDLPGAVQVHMNLATYFSRLGGDEPSGGAGLLTEVPARAPVARTGARPPAEER